jgi:nucleotide-binding universal stress UspA family protein
MSFDRKRILLIVDGSEQAFEVVKYASKFFNPDETEVVLFHVMDQVPDAFWDWEKDPLVPHHLEYMQAWEGQKKKKVEAFMSKAREVLMDAGFPRDGIEASIQRRKEGIARDIIVESSGGYNALLLGRKGQSTLEDQLMGSVANKLLARQRAVPLCLVGGRSRTGKVLIGLDNSKGAQRTVALMGGMLRGTNQSVILLHVVRAPQGAVDQPFSAEQVAKLEQNARSAIQPAFDNATRTLTDLGIQPAKIDTKVVTGASSRTSAILKEALSSDCGTIAIGRRGLSEVDEFEMGRVASKLTQIAKNFAIWVVN